MADPLLLGADLAEARQHLDLFTWFQFEEVTRRPIRAEDNLRTIDFKPNGPAFRELVTLQLTTDEQEIIHRAWLVIDRVFIDDPARCVFAADLVKSYLPYAHAGKIDPVILALAQEINIRSMSRSRSVVITGARLPEVPAQPSTGYLAFMGERENHLVVNAHDGTCVAMHNVTRNLPDGTKRFLGLILMREERRLDVA